jgi:subtilisin family serine protease/outer membrane protein OmpA-like peptidoglycan-associated protein
MESNLWELFEDGTGDDEVAAIIRLGHHAVFPQGVRVITQFGDIITVRMRRADIPRVNGEAEVSDMVAGYTYFGPDLEIDAEDAPRSLEPGPTDVRRPEGLAQTGRGVVVGVVDWGFDFAHPAFRNPDGTTRIVALWDQRASKKPGAPMPFAYGMLHTREAIDAALRARDPYAALGYHPADADGGTGSHGTHVAAIAAGSGGPGLPAGVAPGAELVLVHNAPWGEDTSQKLGDSVTVLEALDFIARIAGERPWVVNFSMGKHGESHDGTTLLEQGLDAALRAAPGRAICMSAGNYYDKRIHATGQLRPTERRTLVWEVNEGDSTDNELEIWYSWRDKLVLEVRGPDGALAARVPVGERATLQAGGKVVGNVYHRAHTPSSLDHHIDLFLYRAAPAGSWAVTLEAADVVDGRFHAWIERDAACPRCQSRFRAEDAVGTSTTGTICNGLRTIAVGAYDAHDPERPIGHFSSEGPTRDGRLKPDLCAPGVRVLAARSAPRPPNPDASSQTVMSGTSMAAPHTAGAVACMFEAAPRKLRIEETRNLLLEAAEKPHAHGPDADRYGIGYLDIVAAVSAAEAIPERNGAARRAPAPPPPPVTPADRPASPSPRREAEALMDERVPLHAEPGALMDERVPGHAGPEASMDERVPAHAEAEAVEAAEDRPEATPGERVPPHSEAEAAEAPGEDEPHRRNLVLVSGGPGPFATKDVEHDRSWANYVTPPLLLHALAADDEDVWWFVYKAAYERRWADDSSARRRAADQVRAQGFDSYVELLEARARKRGWNLRWLDDADHLWKRLVTFRKGSISRVVYWGHARDDLWLTLAHRADSSATAVAPAPDEIVRVGAIEPKLADRFAKASAQRLSRFVGCNTSAFAQAFSKAYAVYSEGIEGKVNFASISRTGGEPCLSDGATVNHFAPGGARESHPDWQVAQACASLPGDAEGAPHEIEAAWAPEAELATPGDSTPGGSAGERTALPEVAAGEAAPVAPGPVPPELLAQDVGEALTELADQLVSEGVGRRGAAPLLAEVLVRSGLGEDLRRSPAHPPPSPVELFDAVAYGADPGLRGRIEGTLEVVARPGDRLPGPLLAGDLLLRRGEGGLGHAAVVASPRLRPLEALAAEGLRAESSVPGGYAQVVDGGSRPHRREDRFARRITDSVGRLPADQLVLRRRPAAGERAGESLREAVGVAPCESRLSASALRWRTDRDRGRHPRPQLDVRGQPMCAGQVELVQLGQQGEVVHLLLYNFDIDGSYLKAEHEAALDDLASTLHDRIAGAPVGIDVAYEVRLEGYADKTGDRDYNVALANDREAAVRAYLDAHLDRFTRTPEALIAPHVRILAAPGGFDPSAPPRQSSPHARSVVVRAIPAGAPVPPPLPIPPSPAPSAGNAQELTALVRPVCMSLAATPGAVLGSPPAAGAPFSAALTFPDGWSGALEVGADGIVATQVKLPLEMAHGGATHRMASTVFERLAWKGLELRAPGLPGGRVALPLSAPHLLGTRTAGGTLARLAAGASALFPLEADLQASATVVLGYRVDGRTGAAAPLDLRAAPAGELEPWLRRHGGAPDGSPDLAVVVAFDLCLCSPRDDFQPQAPVPIPPFHVGPAEVARSYPLLSVWSSRPLAAVQATLELTRPRSSSMEGMGRGGVITNALYTDVNADVRSLWSYVDPEFKRLLEAGRVLSFLPRIFPVPGGVGLGAEAVVAILKATPSTRWDSIFAHYALDAARAGLQVVSPRLGRRTDGSSRRRLDVATRGWVPTPVTKVARQGMFDNVHLAPVMGFGGADAFMAPICQHDCLHVHWRWGAAYPDRHLRGWAGGRPYQEAGAPLVPENQSLAISVRGPTLEYQPTAEAVPAAAWQIFMHHGTGYATRLTWLGEGAPALELLELRRGSRDFGAYYYHNRMVETGGASRAADTPRLDEARFAALEAM